MVGKSQTFRGFRRGLVQLPHFIDKPPSNISNGHLQTREGPLSDLFITVFPGLNTVTHGRTQQMICWPTHWLTDRIAFAHLISCRVGTRHWVFWVSVTLPPLKPVNASQFILVFRARLWSVQINSKKHLKPFPSTKGWSKGNSGWKWWATFPRSLLGETSASL